MAVENVRGKYILLDSRPWDRRGCPALRPWVQPAARLEMHSQQADAHRAHVHTMCVPIHVSGHTHQTDTQSAHMNTDSTVDLILLPLSSGTDGVPPVNAVGPSGSQLRLSA